MIGLTAARVVAVRNGDLQRVWVRRVKLFGLGKMLSSRLPWWVREMERNAPGACRQLSEALSLCAKVGLKICFCLGLVSGGLIALRGSEANSHQKSI